MIFEDDNVMLEDVKDLIDPETIDLDVELEEVHDISFPYEPCMEGAQCLVLSLEEEYVDFMSEYDGYQLEHYRETGKLNFFDEASEGGKIEAFKNKAKAMFENFKTKFKVIIDKFRVKMGQLFKNDEEFIKAYGGRIKSADTSGFSFKGYNFTLDKRSMNDARAAVESYIMSLHNTSERDETPAETVEYMRGLALTGSKQTFTAGEYAKGLFKLFRNGESSKIDIGKTVKTSAELEFISKFATVEKKLKEDFSAMKKALDDAIKATSKSKAFDKGTDQAKMISATVKDYKNMVVILQVFNGANLTALRDRNRQARSICAKLITKSKGKDEKKAAVGENAINWI